LIIGNAKFLMEVFRRRIRGGVVVFSFSILASRVDTKRVNAEIQREIQLVVFLIL